MRTAVAVLAFVSAVLAVASTAAAQTLLTPGLYTMPSGSSVTQIADGSGTVTVPTPPPPPPPASRCDVLRAALGGGFINCWSWENPEDAALQDPGRPGEMASPYVSVDCSMSASGKCSLKMETESYKTAKERCGPLCTEQQIVWRAIQSNTRWWNRQMSQNLSVGFGAGDGPVYYQVTLRENAAFYAGPWGGDGPKKFMFDVGDRWLNFRASLCEPLPATAGKGAKFKLCMGDPVAYMPNYGTISVGDERIYYFGRDVLMNTLTIQNRAREGTVAQNHEKGAATHLRTVQYAVGCMDSELPISQLWDYRPGPYHSCGAKDKTYEGFTLPLINASGLTTDWLEEPAGKGMGTWNDTLKRWENYCSYNKIRQGDLSNCIRDEPEKWVTYTVMVDVADWYDGTSRLYKHASTYRVWRDRDIIVDVRPDRRHPRSDAIPQEQCEKADLTKTTLQWPANRSRPNANVCLGGWDLVRRPYTPNNQSTRGGPITLEEFLGDVPAGRYSMIWLGMMSWHRKEDFLRAQTAGTLETAWPICCHPPITRWFDDLVFSRVPIPLPDGTYPDDMLRGGQ